jgi:MFS family permease
LTELRQSGVRLMGLAAGLLFLESALYTVLVPLLPTLQHQNRLSAAQAGVLIAMFPLGGVAGGLPVAVAFARLGARATVVVALIVLAGASLVFGTTGTYSVLLGARALQGMAGTAIWIGAMIWIVQVARGERRGAMIGLALGVGAAGQIAGPVLGGVIVAVGRGPAFNTMAVVWLLMVPAVLASASPPTRIEEPLAVGPALRSRDMRLGMWLLGVPALSTGAAVVLGPLQLSHLGAHAGVIAATFGIAAAASIVTRPLAGRWSDRWGRLRALRIALSACGAILLALGWPNSEWVAAILIVAAVVAIGSLFAPAIAWLSDTCQAIGVSQIVAMGVTTLAWGPASILGSAGAGALVQLGGLRVAYMTLAAIPLVTAVAIRGREARSTQPPRPTSPCRVD